MVYMVSQGYIYELYSANNINIFLEKWHTYILENAFRFQIREHKEVRLCFRSLTAVNNNLPNLFDAYKSPNII